MKYVIAFIVCALIAWPLLIWIYDGEFSSDVWITAAVLWGGLGIAAFVTIVIQKKKLF